MKLITEKFYFKSTKYLQFSGRQRKPKSMPFSYKVFEQKLPDFHS